MLTEITVAVPPTIASLDLVLDAASVAVTEESLSQVVGEVARRGRLELADLTGAHRQLSVRQPPRPARAPNGVIRPVATSPPPTATHRTEWSAALVTDIATSATAPTRVLHSKRKSSTA